MTWIILRTEHRKEAYAAASVRRMGYDVWLPAQVIVTRPGMTRRVTSAARHAIRELPILPKRFFARIVDWHDLETQSELLTVRFVEGVERNSEQLAAMVPDAEIRAFRAAVDAENTATLALAQKASRRQKARWKSLHDALLELVNQAKDQMEAAA